MNTTRFLLLFSCVAWTAVDLHGGETATGAAPSISTELQSVRRAMLQLHNAERRSEQLGPLLGNAKLHRAAQRHAEWMAANEVLAHAPEDEPTPAERIGDAGYQATNWGENIAYGFTQPKEVMNLWLDSPPHKGNILGAFQDLGIGYAVSKQGQPYWCAVYGATGEGDTPIGEGDTTDEP